MTFVECFENHRNTAAMGKMMNGFGVTDLVIPVLDAYVCSCAIPEHFSGDSIFLTIANEQ